MNYSCIRWDWADSAKGKYRRHQHLFSSSVASSTGTGSPQHRFQCRFLDRTLSCFPAYRKAPLTWGFNIFSYKFLMKKFLGTDFSGNCWITDRVQGFCLQNLWCHRREHQSKWKFKINDSSRVLTASVLMFTVYVSAYGQMWGTQQSHDSALQASRNCVSFSWIIKGLILVWYVPWIYELITISVQLLRMPLMTNT